jgi:hypothetical protein
MPTTSDLMSLALRMVGWDNIPGDSAIHVPGRDIKTLLVALEVGCSELLLARDLGFDAVLGHLPTGTPVSLTSWQIYRRHRELLMAMGVPRAAAEIATEETAQALRVQAHQHNYDRVSSVARLLGLPFLTIHSPLDELGRQAMQRAVDSLQREEPEATVGEIAAHLTATFPEILNAPTQIAVRVGDPDRPAGKTIVAHGALTSGGARVARAFWQHGVDTVIYIQIPPDDLRQLATQGNPGNLIVTGRVAGESVGINAFLAEAERQLGVEPVRLNGITSPEAIET